MEEMNMIVGPSYKERGTFQLGEDAANVAMQFSA